jgi:uncharacterized protein YbjT (DUF2867 family)
VRVLVTGATGFVGSRLVRALRARDHEVAALTRDAAGYEGDADTVYEGDVLEAGSFEHALSDVDAAYYLVHSLGADDFQEKDRRGAENFRRAASEHGVDRVVYLSGLGDSEENGEGDEKDGDDSGDGAELSPHLASRREVERVLSGGTFDLTVLRAAIVVGEGNESFRIVRQLATRLPVMVTPRWVRTDCQPIAIDDVVAYLVGVLETPATAGGTYDVGGPEVLTYEAMLERTSQALGHHAVIVPVPVLTPGLSTHWVELVTDVPDDVVRPLVKGLRNEVTADDGPIREHLPIELTSYRLAVERAVDEDAGRSTTERVRSKLEGAVDA